MNPLLNRVLGQSSPSLLALDAWAEKEAADRRDGKKKCAVDEEGVLLDNLTLELRVNPPEIHVDNDADGAATVVTIDSANRPGSLVYVMQHFVELGLRVARARISSDGGWFHDVFHVAEAAGGGKVRSARKIAAIRGILDVYLRRDAELAPNGDDTDDAAAVETTVLEAAGADAPGLLAGLSDLLTANGCDVRSAALWTYRGRVAFVMSLTERGRPVADAPKLARLRALVEGLMARGGGALVAFSVVRGEVHHDRRLHSLMLRDESAALARGEALADPDAEPAAAGAVGRAGSGGSAGGESAASSSPRGGAAPAAPPPPPPPPPPGGALSPWRSPKFDRPAVDVDHCAHPDYWAVTIRSRDRPKLVFDVVCALADCEYDIFHATVDCGVFEGGGGDGAGGAGGGPAGVAIGGAAGAGDGRAAGAAEEARLEFYVRPRGADAEFDAARAARLAALLRSAVQRRHPRGLKVHVRSLDRFGCLAGLARSLADAGLAITRAKVRTFAASNSSGHTLYVMGADGGPPDREALAAACRAIGGRPEDGGGGGPRPAGPPPSGGERFRYSFSTLQRSWASSWGGGSPPEFGGGSLESCGSA